MSDDPSWPAGYEHLGAAGIKEHLGKMAERFAAEADDPKLAALRRLAVESRRIIGEVMSTEADPAAIDRATELLRAALAELVDEPHGRPFSGSEGSLIADPANRNFVEFSPFVGRSNPLAPPMTMWMEGETIYGSVVFGPAYEGPPGHVHGGYIAAAFDEVLGFVQSVTGRPGMTGRLTISYRSPTPLHVPLRFEGRVLEVQGRKIFTEATLRAGDTLCAEAQGLFISIPPSRFGSLLAERRRYDGQD
jgi:hypothetical protein